MFPLDVLPDVHLGPVGDGEHAHVLPAPQPAVVQAPELRPLGTRLPLAELVTQREHPLLGTRLLLVPPGTAKDRVEAVLQDGVQERGGLEPVARRVAGLLTHAAGIDGVLDRGHDQPLAQLGDTPITEVDDLREVVAGVHVHQREREARRSERLLRQSQQHDGVLATREQQHRVLELGCDLAHDEDRLGLQRVEVGEDRGAVTWAASIMGILWDQQVRDDADLAVGLGR